MFTQDYSNGPSIVGFKEFVSKKDANEHYAWMNPSICACGQYAKSIGSKDWMYSDIGSTKLWSQLNRFARGDGDKNGDKLQDGWTFGALAERLKEVA